MIRKLFISLIFAIAMACGIGAARADETACLNALAGELVGIIDAHDMGDTLVLTSDGFVEFFAKNIDACRDYLLSKEDEEDISIVTDELIMDVNWDYLRTEVAAALTMLAKERTLFVCRNSRAIQATIDVALWATTVVSAVASFGTGAVAVQAARVGVTQGAKNLVRAVTHKGVTTTVKAAAVNKISKGAVEQATKESAKAAAEFAAKKTAYTTATRAVTNNATIKATRAALRGGTKKKIQDPVVRAELQKKLAATPGDASLTQAIKLLDDKAAAKAAQAAAKTAAEAAKGVVTTETAAATKALADALTTFAISTPIAAAGGVASIYSYLESELNPHVMNCSAVDRGGGCYTTCNESLGSPSDDLNTKVFKKVFGKNLCVDEESYILREISSGLPTPGAPFITNEKRWATAQDLIKKNVAEQGKCDWKMNDIDLYVGTPLYDPSTLLPTNDGTESFILDAIRIDD